MDNGNGFITIHRKMLNTSFFLDTRAFHLAMYLLLTATHKDRNIHVGQQEITLRRGQVLGGFKRLDRELGWRKIHVRRAFYKLQDAGFCTHYCTNKYAIVTITNYNSYQNDSGVQKDTPDQNVTPKGVTESILECVEVPPYNNDIYNNKNNIDHFEDLWSQYPKKVGKRKAQGYFNTSVKNQKNWEEIRAALSNYLNSKRVANGWVMDGKTWLYNWQDWITDPESGTVNEFDEIKESMK